MRLRELPSRPCPILALAPMQDVTDLPFWAVTQRYGPADLYFTEYFRVHAHSTPERDILRSVDENPTGRPVMAQLIGQDADGLVRTAVALQRHNIAGIDLNLGCPAPVVCNKAAGGGLLRRPAQIDRLLARLRDAVDGNLTVKTRLGFDAPEEFDRLLDVFAAHPIDGLSVHGRTVREKYATPIHYRWIREAVRRLECPVLANGNIVSVDLAARTVRETGAAGLMIGRGAIRNPWLFSQIRAHFQSGHTACQPALRDLRGYILALFEAIARPGLAEHRQVSKMKRYMNYIGQGIGESDAFLYRIRRATTKAEFKAICDTFLLSDEPLASAPPTTSPIFAGLAGS